VPIHVKKDGIWVPPQKIHAKQSGIWKEANNVYIKDGGAWKLLYSTYNITTSSNDVNLYTAMGSPTTALTAIITIDDNIDIASTNILTPALDIGAFPADSIIYLTIGSNTYITGRGGTGGAGSDSGGGNPQAGTPGGTALKTSLPIFITNNGTIGGGGGGGGGGGSYRVYYSAGNGGGGAGGYHYATTSGALGISPGYNVSIPAGVGGIAAGPRVERNTSPRATDGTKTTGGAGSLDAAGGRGGGAGGNLGFAGVNGTSGAAGGAAGNAVEGDSNITWNTLGTILGNRV